MAIRDTRLLWHLEDRLEMYQSFCYGMVAAIRSGAIERGRAYSGVALMDIAMEASGSDEWSSGVVARAACKHIGVFQWTTNGFAGRSILEKEHAFLELAHLLDQIGSERIQVLDAHQKKVRQEPAPGKAKRAEGSSGDPLRPAQSEMLLDGLQ